MENRKVDSFVSRFINKLYQNENNTDTEHLKNLYSKKDYYVLLKDVITLLKAQPNNNIEFYRAQLFEASGIKEIIWDFIYARNLMPGIILSYGTNQNRDKIICGNMQDVIYYDGVYHNAPIKMQEDTIFDLASTSKLFTSLSLLKLCEAGLLNLNDPIRKYVPEFNNLENITVYDLMTFQIPIKSAERIDVAESIEQANNSVFTLAKEENHSLSFPYTDMGSIALRYVIERISNMPLNEFIEQEIIRKYHLNNTFLNVPLDLLNKVANENYSSRVDADGRILTMYDNIPGTVHDGKARALGHAQGIAPGHAGYFSNEEDLQKLAAAIIKGEVLNKNHTLMLGQNVVGKLVTLESGIKTYNCHHGLLTYVKQADPFFLSTVRPYLSGKSFACPGFTGTSLCIDPLNEVSAVMATNRLHNRIYTVHPNHRSEIKSHEKGYREYTSPFTGETKKLSSSYTRDSAEITDIAMKLALQYKLLEDFLNQKEELKLVKHI